MNTSKRKWIRAALFGLAFLFITLGTIRGENNTVLKKAVNICMECIGIG